MKELTKEFKAKVVKGIHLMKAGDKNASEMFYKSCGFNGYPVNKDNN